MVNYELRLRGGFDKGAVIAILDGLRECFQETGVSATVYSPDKKRGIIVIEDIERREVLDSALGKHAPPGLKYDILELDKSAVPKEHMSALYEMQRRLDDAESEKDKAHAELREANKRTEQEVRARIALVEIKESLIRQADEEKTRREELERKYGDLFKQFDRLATTRADPKDAGITKVLSFATELKKYDERFEQTLAGAGGLSLTDMSDIYGMSLIDYANKVLAPHGVPISSEQELDSLGSVPSGEETNNYETAKQEVKFLEDLESGKISGIPKHLLPALTSAIDMGKDEDIVKKYEAKLKASGEAAKIRSVYQKASEAKAVREEVRGQSLRVPYFIVNGEAGDDRTIEIFAPSGISSGAVSRAVAKLGAGVGAVLPSDSKTEEPIARGRFVQITSRLPKSNYDTPAIVELQRKVARQILDLAESELNALGFGVSVMEMSNY